MLVKHMIKHQNVLKSVHRMFSFTAPLFQKGVKELLKQAPLIPTQSAKNPIENKQESFSNQFAKKVVEIRLRRNKKQMDVRFNTGEQFVYSAEFLRVESPSAEVQGHGPLEQKRLVFAKKNVEILRIEPVGTYAVRIVFSDNHDTGIYTWTYLYELGIHKFTLMKRYILALKQANRSRMPRIQNKK